MPVPKPVEFLLRIPLYAKSPYRGEKAWEVVDVLYFGGTFDSYCVKCKRDSTFQAIAPERPPALVRNPNRERLLKQHGVPLELPPLEVGMHLVHARCTRVAAHTQGFAFLIDREIEQVEGQEPAWLWSIQKVGQHPSYGDLHLNRVKKYAPVLSGPQLSEFSRAIGLASHDVGVGAYVYLRRIFEGLVEEAHAVAKGDPAWDDAQYEKSRMSERISQLRQHLPPFLVEHPGMYSLLSKGLHELSEDECLRHFETLRLGIELILDERLESRERALKTAAASAAIQKALGGAGA